MTLLGLVEAGPGLIARPGRPPWRPPPNSSIT